MHAVSGSWPSTRACSTPRCDPPRSSDCAARTATCPRPDGVGSPWKSPVPRSTVAGPIPTQPMMSADSSTGPPAGRPLLRDPQAVGRLRVKAQPLGPELGLADRPQLYDELMSPGKGHQPCRGASRRQRSCGCGAARSCRSRAPAAPWLRAGESGAGRAAPYAARQGRPALPVPAPRPCRLIRG